MSSLSQLLRYGDVRQANSSLSYSYFLHEKLGPSAGQEFDTDASEKWKRSIALQAPLMS